MTFNDLGLSPAILKALDLANYTSPTPIQREAIPAALTGRDVLGCAQTGTGKTAAFSLPIIQLLSKQNVNRSGKRPIRSLILTPTRELALQIYENIQVYSKFTGIRSTAVVGGVSQRSQERALALGADILIATPGRLIDLIAQKHADLQQVQLLVLDEADRMLDMGFIHDVKRIIAKMPAKKQTLFFSATMPQEISQLIKTLLVNPVKIEITPVSSTVDRIQQSVYLLENGCKQKQLNRLLEDKSIVSALVFTRTKRGADRVARDLGKVNIAAQAIHGNKSQNERQNALRNFKTGVTRVLVATDIAARGIDIDELSHVINFNLPNIPETYVHRIGRTGRAGMSGIAISLCEAEELPYLKDIQKLIGKTIPEVKDHPYPMIKINPALAAEVAKASKTVASAKAGNQPKAKANPARKPKEEWFTQGNRPRSGSEGGKVEWPDRKDGRAAGSVTGNAGEARTGGPGRKQAGGAGREQANGARTGVAGKGQTRGARAAGAGKAQAGGARTADRAQANGAGRSAGNRPGGSGRNTSGAARG